MKRVLSRAVRPAAWRVAPCFRGAPLTFPGWWPIWGPSLVGSSKAFPCAGDGFGMDPVGLGKTRRLRSMGICEGCAVPRGLVCVFVVPPAAHGRFSPVSTGPL